MKRKPFFSMMTAALLAVVFTSCGVSRQGHPNQKGQQNAPTEAIIQNNELIRKASQWQGKGDYPGVDDWETGYLQKGDTIYGGIPGQSEFYLSKASLEAAGGSKEKLWRSAQVKAHAKFGYREKVQAYVVLADIVVATSIVKANPHLGEGGAIQYFVENYKEVLQPVGEPIKLK